jgi:hypothetical protein
MAAGGGGVEETTSAVTCSGFVVCESAFINQYNLAVQVKFLDEKTEQEKPRIRAIKSCNKIFTVYPVALNLSKYKIYNHKNMNPPTIWLMYPSQFYQRIFFTLGRKNV